MEKTRNTRIVGIGYLIRAMRETKWLAIISLVFLMLGSVASSLEPLWLKKIIDSITGGNTVLAAISMPIMVYFGLKLVETIFDMLRDIIFAPVEMSVIKTLSEQLFGHLIKLPVQYHNDQRMGRTSRRITRGNRAISLVLDFIVGNVLPTLFSLVFATIVLFKLYAPVYAIITFSTIVGYAAFTLIATEWRSKYRKLANDADDDVSGIEVDSITNIDTVKYFNNEDFQLKKYWESTKKRYNLFVLSDYLFAVIGGIQGLILLVGLGALLYLGILQNLRHQMTVGDLVLLTTYVGQLSAPIGVLGMIYRQIKDGLTDLDGMAKIMDEPIEIIEPTNPQEITDPKGKVEFRHVSFTYPNGRNVLNDISLIVEPGQKIAFVGPSGVGKSTIVKLLFRLYSLSAGNIFIDDIPLDQLGKESRHHIFAIVPQEPVLFNSTVVENIRFGKPEASLEEIKAAAVLANADTFVTSLKNGYDTVVGERGVKLSGGEKQRVAIARAVLRDPKVLVFDEATSALDSHNEGIIQESLDRVAKGRTTIAIAHRLSTITDSDTIYVLKEGKIAEQGRHEELLAKNGIYAQMWRLQAEQGVEPISEEGDGESMDLLLESESLK